jgi:hypothetical protein
LHEETIGDSWPRDQLARCLLWKVRHSWEEFKFTWIVSLTKFELISTGRYRQRPNATRQRLCSPKLMRLHPLLPLHSRWTKAGNPR